MPDSVCGTWETLADALTPGGSATLKKEGYPRVGQEKYGWASSITPHIDINANRSPSFHAFRQGLLKLVARDS